MSRPTGMFAMMRRVARTPSLRRIELGFAAFAAGEHGTWLAILVYALEQGGPKEVGLVAVAQLLPGVVLAPFAAYVGDRFAPHRALAFGYAAQSVSMAATAILMAAGTTLPAYIAAAVVATCITFSRPAMASLLPGVTHSPSELVAANVVTGLIEQLGVLVGPLLAGALIAGVSPAAVFGVMAVAMAAAGVSTLLIRDIEKTTVAPVGTVDLRRQVLAGFATLTRERRLRILVLLGAAAGFVKGISDVIFVTFADARLPSGGNAAGLLSAAYGAGAIAGAAVLGRLARRGRLSRQFLLATGLAAAALALLAGLEVTILAMAAFLALGSAETLMQLLSSVTIQRESPTDVTSRVFGILEGMKMGAIALGSFVVAALTAWRSIGVALVALSGIVLILGAVSVQRLVRAGSDVAPVDEAVIDRLLDDPIIAPLMAPTVERLARAVRTRTYRPGEHIISEGEAGDRYYLVTDGTLDVSIGGAHVREMGPGASFGEIALLRDVPRTATVVARTPVEVLTLERDEFLTAVTGHPRSHLVASATVVRLLE